MYPTVQQSGASSQPTTTSNVGTRDDWLPTTVADASNTSSGGSGTGSPRLIIETSNGHQIVLTYQDLALAALLLGVTVKAVGWVR